MSFLLGPPPAADPGVITDPIVTLALDKAACLVTATTASGVALAAEVTEPAPGALRCRIAAVPSALDAPADTSLLEPALSTVRCPVVANSDGVRVATSGPPFAWSAGGGFAYGPLRQAPPGSPGTGRYRSCASPPATNSEGFLLSLHLEPETAVFGGGESFGGPDLRGRVRRLVNAETHGAGNLDLAYLNVPLFVTDSGWGVYVHAAAPLRADIGATHSETLVLEVPGSLADLFFYLGDPAEILSAHHRVTGLPGRFPDWALGVWTSRCTYIDSAEVLQVLDGYAAADCPVDVVHVDAWQTGNVLADLTTAWEVDRSRWPAGWASELATRDVRLSLWHNPYLRTGTSAGDEAVAAGFVLLDAEGEPVFTNDMPDRLLVDFSNPASVDWWRKQVAALVVGEGASAMKCDFAEEVPPWAVLSDGRTGWQARNSYAAIYQAATAAALADVLGERDVALFCRSGTAGAQRYPCHWVGDTPSSWAGLVGALRGCLSLSLSGFAVVGSDIGGFWTADSVFSATEAFVRRDPSVFTADVDPELFTRWTQWGALSPVMRFHGTGKREPWAYPQPYATHAVAACRLRRRLGGYLSRVAAEAACTGIPMMRPMALAYPGERSGRESLQYLLGPELLVAPVLRPGGRVEVWVPPGSWRGLDGAPDLSGPGWTSLELRISELPAWVAEGAEVLAP